MLSSVHIDGSNFGLAQRCEAHLSDVNVNTLTSVTGCQKLPQNMMSTAVLVELAQRNAFPVPSISSNLVLLGHCSTTNFGILAILVFKPTCVLKCIVHFKILFVFNLFVELAYSAQNSSMLQFFFLNPWLCENVK